MSYIKLGQIADVVSGNPNIIGSIYIEDENQNVLVSKSPVFPLNVTVEVIDWGSQSVQEIHGPFISFNVELLTIPDQSISIRQYVFNQLVSKYPSLVI